MRQRDNPQNHKIIKSLPRLLLLIFGISIIVSLIFMGINLLKLKDIECESQFGSCNPMVEEKLKSIKGKSYLQAITLIKNTAKKEVIIEEYRLHYKPISIKINVIEKRPIFALAKSDQNQIVLVDKNGLVLSQTDNTSLPAVFINDNLPPMSDIIDNKKLFALNLILLMSSTYPFNKGILLNDSLIVELPDNLKVVFPLEGDMELLMGSFILIYNDLANPENSKLNTQEQIIDTIDLRFKNPVLN